MSRRCNEHTPSGFRAMDEPFEELEKSVAVSLAGAGERLNMSEMIDYGLRAETTRKKFAVQRTLAPHSENGGKISGLNFVTDLRMKNQASVEILVLFFLCFCQRVDAKAVNTKCCGASKVTQWVRRCVLGMKWVDDHLDQNDENVYEISKRPRFSEYEGPNYNTRAVGQAPQENRMCFGTAELAEDEQSENPLRPDTHDLDSVERRRYWILAEQNSQVSKFGVPRSKCTCIIFKCRDNLYLLNELLNVEFGPELTKL
ncbi:hypothetical protein BDN70DRAFT_925926 [Pholiota conissans]|uniref:Uncharacterized protein n=1 Tax=Pholiota conissans TaxID=109636 RepID=A0A9P5YNP2_9AGAR|nr:hypothetical protein BDN70DRAFT_925926 [Pholiota conissans]